MLTRDGANFHAIPTKLFDIANNYGTRSGIRKRCSATATEYRSIGSPGRFVTGDGWIRKGKGKILRMCCIAQVRSPHASGGYAGEPGSPRANLYDRAGVCSPVGSIGGQLTNLSAVTQNQPLRDCHEINVSNISVIRMNCIVPFSVE
jgi:hypothetical protein